MKAARKIFFSDRGASITAIVIMIVLLTSMGVVFTSLLSTRVEESTGEVTSMRALYIAEGGMEAAIGHLKQAPVATNWAWRDGYLDKTLGSGTVDVEVLEYEDRDSTLTGTNDCAPFESTVVATGANPSRTVYVTLAWSGASNMGLELYDANVADCNNPAASATLITSSLTADMPERIRYRIPDAAPATVTYTARVTGTNGDVYRLRISHPDESGFSSGNTCGQPVGPPNTKCDRSIISLGKSANSRREVFSAFSRTP